MSAEGPVGGKTIRIYLVDGVPTGMVTAEIMNWTGKVVVAPRTKLAELARRDEPGRTGIYLLSGDDPDSPGKTRVYVGEGDVNADRLSGLLEAGHALCQVIPGCGPPHRCSLGPQRRSRARIPSAWPSATRWRLATATLAESCQRMIARYLLRPYGTAGNVPYQRFHTVREYTYYMSLPSPCKTLSPTRTENRAA